MRSRNRLAASAAAVFVAAMGCGKADVAEAPDATEVAEVKCDGGNGCKGQSDCHTEHSACAGENACKGKGWVMLTPAECAKAGGQPRPS